MMRFVLSCLLVAAVALVAGCATSASSGISGLAVQRPQTVPWPPESMAQEWTFERGADGRVTMRRQWPYGAVEKRLVFILEDESLGPVSGESVYPNRHARPMTDREMRYYWEYAGARHAAERHRQQASSM